MEPCAEGSRSSESFEDVSDTTSCYSTSSTEHREDERNTEGIPMQVEASGFAGLISKLDNIRFESMFGFDFVKAKYTSGKIEYVALADNLACNTSVEVCVAGYLGHPRRILTQPEVLLCFQRLDVNNCLLGEPGSPSCLHFAFRNKRVLRDCSICANCESLKSLFNELFYPVGTRLPTVNGPGLFFRHFPTFS